MERIDLGADLVIHSGKTATQTHGQAIQIRALATPLFQYAVDVILVHQFPRQCSNQKILASPDPVGVAAALAATLLIAQSTLWMSRWQYRDALALTAWQLLLGGMMLLPVALTLTGPPALPRPHAWPGLIWLVLANSALAYWCWVWSLNRFFPAVMSIVSLLNPLSPVLLGVMLLPERLSWPQWLGIALILLAVLLMKIPTAPRRPVRAKAVRGVPPAAAADRPEGSSEQR